MVKILDQYQNKDKNRENRVFKDKENKTNKIHKL